MPLPPRIPKSCFTHNIYYQKLLSFNNYIISAKYKKQNYNMSEMYRGNLLNLLTLSVSLLAALDGTQYNQ